MVFGIKKLLFKGKSNDVNCMNKEFETQDQKRTEEHEAEIKFKRAMDLLDCLIERHFRTLVTKYHQKVIVDDYGGCDFSLFEKEVEYFYENVFLPELVHNNIEVKPDHVSLDRFVFYFDERFQPLLDKFLSEESQSDEINSPIEFEEHCANVLNRIGWNARTTKGSGDQGIDVIAEAADLKLVLQCKMYTGPVGNKSVQEIYAGKQHELANFAAVVTNSSYTKSARQLASTCGVFLLHVDDLQEINNILLSDDDKSNESDIDDAGYIDNLSYSIDLIEKHIVDSDYKVERFKHEGMEMLRVYEGNVPVFHILLSGIGIKISTMNYKIGESLENKECIFRGLNDLNSELQLSKAIANEDGDVTVNAFYFGEYEEERFKYFLLWAKLERDTIFLKFDFEGL